MGSVNVLSEVDLDRIAYDNLPWIHFNFLPHRPNLHVSPQLGRTLCRLLKDNLASLAVPLIELQFSARNLDHVFRWESHLYHISALLAFFPLCFVNAFQREVHTSENYGVTIRRPYAS